jgi:hypothetical protein
MMTIRAVPMRRPVPMEVMRDILREEREKESGSEPARKDLCAVS